MEQTTEKKPTTKVVEQPKQEVKAETKQEPTPSGSKITHKGFAKDSVVQQYVQYAYSIGGMDLVTLIECENGSWNPTKQSEVVKNGQRERSFGFCQISQVYHPEIVNTDSFWNDWKWQINKCKELRAGGTKFYAIDRKIKGVKCSNYVKSRFIFE